MTATIVMATFYLTESSLFSPLLTFLLIPIVNKGNNSEVLQIKNDKNYYKTPLSSNGQGPTTLITLNWLSLLEHVMSPSIKLNCQCNALSQMIDIFSSWQLSFTKEYKNFNSIEYKTTIEVSFIESKDNNKMIE